MPGLLVKKEKVSGTFSKGTFSPPLVTYFSALHNVHYLEKMVPLFYIKLATYKKMV
jgi:hypothetical protein